MLKCHKRSAIRSGFTLMELMVVITIITLLIGILVPGMQHVKRLARSIEQKSMFRNIEIGLGLFAEQYDGFPRQLKMFGRFALDNPDILALETVTTVAERAKVQPSTILFTHSHLLFFIQSLRSFE